MVLVMSRILSTPRRSTTPTGGIPAAIRIVERITIPVPGADGAPIEATNDVRAIKRIVVNPKSMPNNWARKNMATI